MAKKKRGRVEDDDNNDNNNEEEENVKRLTTTTTTTIKGKKRKKEYVDNNDSDNKEEEPSLKKSKTISQEEEPLEPPVIVRQPPPAAAQPPPAAAAVVVSIPNPRIVVEEEEESLLLSSSSSSKKEPFITNSNASTPIEQNFRTNTKTTSTTTTTTSTTTNASTKKTDNDDGRHVGFVKSMTAQTPSPVNFTNELRRTTDEDKSIVHPHVIHPNTTTTVNTTTTTNNNNNPYLFVLYGIVWFFLHVIVSITSDGVLVTPFWIEYQQLWRDYQIILDTPPPPIISHIPEPELVVVEEEEEYVITEEFVDKVVLNPKLAPDYFDQLWNDYLTSQQEHNVQMAMDLLSTLPPLEEEKTNTDDDDDDELFLLEEKKSTLEQWDQQLRQLETTPLSSSSIHYPSMMEDVLMLDPQFLTHHQQQQQQQQPIQPHNNIQHSNPHIHWKDIDNMKRKLRNLTTSTEIQIIQTTNIDTLRQILHTAIQSTNHDDEEDDDEEIAYMKSQDADLQRQIKETTFYIQELMMQNNNPKDDATNNNENNDNVFYEEEQIKEYVQSILERHDVTGEHDYASIRYGASVITEGKYATSSSLVDNLPALNRLLAKLQLRFYGHGPMAALNPTYPIDSLGQCWSFLPQQKENPKQFISVTAKRHRGTYATLSINLSTSLQSIHSIIVEHPIFSTTATAHNTAIQNFRVIAFEEEDAYGIPYPLGSFQYNIVGDRYLQTFPIDEDQPQPPIIRSVVLSIDSNWGADYTCLYRFRVQGEESSE